MGFSLRWGGILIGAISLFSLVHQRYAFALIPVIQDGLDHYRSSLHPFADALLQKLSRGPGAESLHWPEIPADLIVVYSVLAILLLWFYVFDDLEWSQSGEETITLWSLLGRAVIALFWPLILPAALYLITFGKQQSSLKSWGQEISKILASFVILYGANACLSTLL
jgi:hypothetical protein